MIERVPSVCGLGACCPTWVCFPDPTAGTYQVLCLRYTLYYRCRKKQVIPCIFGGSHSSRESETTEDPFQSTPEWLGAHVIASAYNDATPGTVWGSPKHWGLTILPTRPTPESRFSQDATHVCPVPHGLVHWVIRHFPSWLYITCVCTPGQGKPWSLYSSGLVVVIYDAATNLAHHPDCKECTVGRAQR